MRLRTSDRATLARARVASLSSDGLGGCRGLQAERAKAGERRGLAADDPLADRRMRPGIRATCPRVEFGTGEDGQQEGAGACPTVHRNQPDVVHGTLLSLSPRHKGKRHKKSHLAVARTFTESHRQLFAVGVISLFGSFGELHPHRFPRWDRSRQWSMARSRAHKAQSRMMLQHQWPRRSTFRREGSRGHLGGQPGTALAMASKDPGIDGYGRRLQNALKRI